MLSFEDWERTINETNNQITKIANRIYFRKLEICGPQSADRRKVCDSDEDFRKVTSDPEILKLEHLRELLNIQLDYIRRTGEMPPSLKELDENLSRQ